MLHGIFDTHAHYDDPCFAGRLDAVLAAQRAAGVETILNIGSDLPSSAASAALAAAQPMMVAAVGVFPLSCAGLPANWLTELEALAARPKVVAIGEIGLDYHKKDADRDTQKAVFSAQLALAARLGLPVEIHDREADPDMLALLRTARPAGEIHRFFGTPDYGRAYLALGLSLAIGPEITYPTGAHILETVRTMPMERMLLETDAPFLPVADRAGEKADSAMLIPVAQQIAALRGISAQQVVDCTRDNARRLFGLGRS